MLDGRVVGGVAEMNDELLAILQCPVAHVPVVRNGDWIYSTDPKTRRKYPIQDGIPIMLIEEASTADPDEFERVMAGADQNADADGTKTKV